MSSNRLPTSLPKQILLDLLSGLEYIHSDYRQIRMNSPFRYNKTSPQYLTTLRRLQKRGLVNKQDDKVLLSNRGRKVAQLLLSSKKLTPKNRKWDGRWRLICFDIPEHLRKERRLLRSFLYHSNFKKLQGSVWVSPDDVLDDAIKTWRHLGLQNYIRSALVSWFDNQSDLKNKFNL